MFTAKRMIISKRLAALAAAHLSHASVASSDATARHAEAPHLGSDGRQRHQFANTAFTIINTTTIATAASARIAATKAPSRRFKVLPAAEFASKKLDSSSCMQLPVERSASCVNKRSNSTSGIGSLICHPNGSSRSVGSCLLDISKKARNDHGLKCMLKRRLKGKLTQTGQAYERNQSRSVHWNSAGPTSVAHWNRHDRESRNLYIFSLKEHRNMANAEKEAEQIVDIATDLDYWKDCLPDHLRVRLEVEPNQYADWKYLSEFLTLEDMKQFHQDCNGPIRERAQSIIRSAWRKTASRTQELRVQMLHSEENVQFDSSVEPIVASTVGPRWETDLDSSLGKYWELPERTARRARKQTSFFSPC